MADLMFSLLANVPLLAMTASLTTTPADNRKQSLNFRRTCSKTQSDVSICEKPKLWKANITGLLQLSEGPELTALAHSDSQWM